MSIVEFRDYDEYINLIKDTNYIKILLFSKENCKACEKSIVELEKIALLLSNNKLIIKEIKMHNNKEKNIVNEKIFDNYKVNLAPSYVLIYNNNFEKIVNPHKKYIIERIDIILKKLENFSP